MPTLLPILATFSPTLILLIAGLTLPTHQLIDLGALQRLPVSEMIAPINDKNRTEFLSP
jgi:hypothetical protein